MIFVAKPDGVKYTDKCYLLVMKNDTQYYVRGCLRAEHEAKYCQSAVAIRNFEMSGMFFVVTIQFRNV